MNEEKPFSTEPSHLRPRLTEVREGLLHLHKTLLESEQVSYEAAFGKINSPYQLLHLLTNDPWFAWLAPLTHLLTDLDERLDAQEPLTAVAVNELVNQAKHLLVASETGAGFARHFDEALQRCPDVVLAQAAMAKILRAAAAR